MFVLSWLFLLSPWLLRTPLCLILTSENFKRVYKHRVLHIFYSTYRSQRKFVLYDSCWDVAGGNKIVFLSIIANTAVYSSCCFDGTATSIYATANIVYYVLVML